jgi:hypothetical protein
MRVRDKAKEKAKMMDSYAGSNPKLQPIRGQQKFGATFYTKID